MYDKAFSMEFQKEYPQTVCGMSWCNNKLNPPNNVPMTSQMCDKCAKTHGYDAWCKKHEV